MADVLSSGLFISEILADNAGGSATDTDGDGQSNKADEYIEIQNTTNGTLSLDGYELWSEKLGQIYAFGPGDTIAAGGTATVLGEYTGTPPAGFFDSGGSPNGNFLPDGQGSLWDNVYLVDTNTGEYVVLGYGLPPRPYNPPSGFPGTTQVGSGESINSGAPNGLSITRDADGNLIETTPSPGVPDPVCFVEGTRLRMADGSDRAVEDIEPGDLLWTQDSESCPVAEVAVCEGDGYGRRAPVVFAPGALGNTVEVAVSPQHRVVLRDPQADLMFGTDQCLVPAIHLAGMPGIARSPRERVRYYHIVLDQHRIVNSGGLLSESFFPGARAMAALDRETQEEIEDFFPHLNGDRPALVAISLRAPESRLLYSAIARSDACSRQSE